MTVVIRVMIAKLVSVTTALMVTLMIIVPLHSLAVVAALEEGNLGPMIPTLIVVVAVVAKLLGLIIIVAAAAAAAALIVEMVSTVVVRSDMHRDRDRE